jgi:hypothetical protein
LDLPPHHRGAARGVAVDADVIADHGFYDHDFAPLSLFQNLVGFSQALVVSRPMACKATIFQGCCFKTEVLKQPLLSIKAAG